MRWLFFILLLISLPRVQAQSDSSVLKTALQQLDRALLGMDEEVLKLLLHKDLSFGHSNAWTQSWQEVLDDGKTSKLVYRQLANEEVKIVALSKKRATVRMKTEAGGIVNGKAFRLTLHVMQVWIKNKKQWQLLARQSARL